MTRYKITNPNGLSGRAWDREYPTVELAAEIIRLAYQWDDVLVSDWFLDRNDTRSCCAYADHEERDRDQDGAHAPWITEVRS